MLCGQMPWLLGACGLSIGLSTIPGVFYASHFLKFDFEQQKKMVDEYGQEQQEPITLERTHFQPDWRHGQVTTRTQKRYVFN